MPGMYLSTTPAMNYCFYVMVSLYKLIIEQRSPICVYVYLYTGYPSAIHVHIIHIDNIALSYFSCHTYRRFVVSSVVIHDPWAIDLTFVHGHKFCYNESESSIVLVFFFHQKVKMPDG